MKFDDVLKDIGEFGPFQRRVYVLAVLPAMLVAFESMSVIFIFNIPKHRCAIPGYPNDTYHAHDETHATMINVSIPLRDGEWDECHVYDDITSNGFWTRHLSNRSGDVRNASQITCNSWVFDHSTFESTAATDFDVVCDRSMQRATSNVIAQAGSVTCSLICGFLSDRFGRKITFYVGGLALISGGFGIAFTHSLTTFNICRFIISMARVAVFVNCLLIGMEMVGPSKRAFASLGAEVVWCTGSFLLLLTAYFVRNWRYLEIVVSIPSIGMLFYWWLIPESPRWLASRGRDTEALQILEKIAASNKTKDKLPRIEDTKQLLEGDPKVSFLHVLRSRELTIRMLIIFSNMFVVVLVYYGLTLNITNLSGNIFQNYAVNAALEMVAYSSPIFLLDRVGRKPVYCVSLIVSGVACVMSIVPVMLNAQAWIVTMLSMVGRFFVCVAFAVAYLYAPELFPTVVRSSTVGVGVTFSRIGNIISPYLADLGILVGGRLSDALPLLVMGCPAVLMGLLSLWLPETKGVKLPETMADIQERTRRRWCFSSDDNNEEDEGIDVNASSTETC